MNPRTRINPLLYILASIAAPSHASNYTTLLDANSYAVGATLGENLIVNEGCMIPADDEATCEKAKYISAESGRVGSTELPLSIAEGFDVSMGIDINAASDGAVGGQSLILQAADGSEILFTYDRYYPDCLSSHTLDSGGSSSVYGVGSYLYSSIDNFRIGLYNGIAECYFNDIATTSSSKPVQITLSDPNRLFNGVLIAGIKDNDRLFDVKYRGEKLNSCDGACEPSTPQPTGSIVISATNGPQISVKGGYMKLDTTSGAAPAPNDCATLEHDGRMVLDNVAGTLYVCTQAGWIGK